jgi:hypothetical protein
VHNQLKDEKLFYILASLTEAFCFSMEYIFVITARAERREKEVCLPTLSAKWE